MGTLILDSMVNKEAVLREAPPGTILVTVGDVTSERISGFGMTPLLQIIDGKTRRAAHEPAGPPPDVEIIRCENPAGGISPECIETIRRALGSSSPLRLVVSGEEDLLVIPACIYAPDGAVIMYGQPGRGLVAIHVDAGIRYKAKGLLDSVS
ncbi:uncharacterized protein conserved in archaea [Cenarchaeum symbiosum A]|uniref:GTP-dependent dephospho-CoA kinase n=1 Tax=Cenarchaeum symbiosum (strain A) TaxID=414004 RepID=DPCKG_CENSY|nr:RecName: Full=GTP-dependent dephospho-CoA kinase; AltName: Full=Dephospho-coenzyme A kinase; Short=DPCK [Cenarchaeum symbiosum A]ABK77598.1 uncharacterized protein conserved in archaea [Cenarchaeum symbiosum A]